jgi:PAS domain S-box-containing protein
VALPNLDDATTRRLELFRVLVEEAREYAIVLLDSDGRISSWNAGAERIAGYPAAEIVGRHFSIFYRTEDIARGLPKRELARAAANGRVEAEGWRVRKDGSTFWAAVVMTAIRDPRGDLIGFTKLARDMTDDHAHREALHQSEERVRLLVDGVSEYAIFMLDPDGCVVSWNPGAERIKGYAAQEIIGQHVSRFYVPEDVAGGKAQRLLAEAARQGKVEDEGWRARKDGTRFWASVVLTALRDQAGQLRGYAKVTRDLTDKREAEARQRQLDREQAARTAAEEAAEMLHRSEERSRAASERLRIVLEGASDGISMQDRTGRLMFANTQAARSCGYDSPEAMLAAPLTDFPARFAIFDTDDRPLPFDQLPGRRVLAGQDPSARLIHVREKGSRREWWSFVQSRAVHDAAGHVEAVVSIWHDVTAARRREEELRFLADAGLLLSSSLDYQTTLRKLADLIVPRLADWCSVDLVEGSELRSLAVAHADPAKVALARELQAKYPPDPKRDTGAAHVVRTGLSELLSEIPDELLTRSVRDAEHLRMVRELGLRSAMMVPIATGERPALGALTLVSAESGRRYDRADLALAEELGRRAALAIENSRHYREAREAIAVRDEFLSVAGHELKTPLAALLLQLQSLCRLAERGDLSTDSARTGERLSKTALLGKRLDRLVKELLDVSRITSGHLTLEPQECDLGALARDVAARFEDEAQAAGCAIQLRLEEGVVGQWDRGRVDQVITNLLANAVKYGRGKPIEVSVGTAGGKARLAVRDHGIGIAPEHQERIFGRFERAVSERNYGGFGLGLWIVGQIVDSHRGQVHLESKVGKGATFVVELPGLTRPGA